MRRPVDKYVNVLEWFLYMSDFSSNYYWKCSNCIILFLTFANKFLNLSLITVKNKKPKYSKIKILTGRRVNNIQLQTLKAIKEW